MRKNALNLDNNKIVKSYAQGATHDCFSDMRLAQLWLTADIKNIKEFVLDKNNNPIYSVYSLKKKNIEIRFTTYAKFIRIEKFENEKQVYMIETLKLYKDGDLLYTDASKKVAINTQTLEIVVENEPKDD